MQCLSPTVQADAATTVFVTSTLHCCWQIIFQPI